MDGSDQFSDYTDPQLSMKNISGVSYRLKPNDLWDINLFAKNYLQSNEGYVAGITGMEVKHNNSLGYGAAGTYFIVPWLQTKVSFERAYRLPSSGELFGDGDLLLGNFGIKPEQSYNYNLNFILNKDVDIHNIHLNAGDISTLRII